MPKIIGTSAGGGLGAPIAYSNMENTSGISGIRGIIKTANETVNNSTVMQDDDALVIAVEANARYSFLLMLSIQIKAASDFKYQFTVPASTTLVGQMSPDASSDASSDLTAATVFLVAGNKTLLILTYGRLITASTAGNCQLQWAQNTAAVEDTIVEQGSFIQILRLS